MTAVAAYLGVLYFVLMLSVFAGEQQRYPPAPARVAALVVAAGLAACMAADHRWSLTLLWLVTGWSNCSTLADAYDPTLLPGHGREIRPPWAAASRCRAGRNGEARI